MPQLAAFPALDIRKPACPQNTTWCATTSGRRDALGTLGFQLLGRSLVWALALAVHTLADSLVATLAAIGPQTVALGSGLTRSLSTSLQPHNKATHTPHPKRDR